MPKRIIPLSDMKVQKAKSKDKTVTLFDGGGLFLMVTPSGGKLWRFKYRYDGKQKLLAFGITRKSVYKMRVKNEMKPEGS